MNISLNNPNVQLRTLVLTMAVWRRYAQPSMSITEVARLAGLSHTTVSRVINNKPGVAPQTVRNVRRAMAELGYTPPNTRRGPQTRARDGVRARSIATLLVGADLGLARVSLISAILHAVERALAERKLSMTFGQVSEHGQLPPNLSGDAVDGLLLLGRTPEGELRERLEGFPTVWLLTRRGGEDWGDRVRPNNAAVARLAGRYLLERGHRHLAYLNPTPEHPAFVERGGVLRAMAEEAGATLAQIDAGAPKPPGDLLSIRDELADDRMEQMIERLLGLDPRPTGVFVPADTAAALAYRALRRRGVEPGKDLEIVSCNNDRSALIGLDPRPATIDLRPDVIGQRAVTQLLARLRDPFAPVRADLLVEPALIPADAALPAGADGGGQG